MDILIIYNETCPSFEPALKRITEVINDLKISSKIESKLIYNDSEAKKYKLDKD